MKLEDGKLNDVREFKDGEGKILEEVVVVLVEWLDGIVILILLLLGFKFVLLLSDDETMLLALGLG